MIRSIRYAFLCAISLLLWPGIVLADGPENLQRLLKGDYRVTGEVLCVQSASGFSGAPFWYPCSDWNPETGPGPNCQPPSQYEVTLIGLFSFDGKGNAHSTFKTLDVQDSSFHLHSEPFTPPFPAPFTFTGSEGECHFTYNVNPDRTFTMQQRYCSGTVRIGTPTPLSLYTGPAAEIQGFIAQGGQTLATTMVEPAEQTIIVDSTTGTRVCSETTQYYRAWPNQGADGHGQQPAETDNLDPRPWW